MSFAGECKWFYWCLKAYFSLTFHLSLQHLLNIHSTWEKEKKKPKYSPPMWSINVSCGRQSLSAFICYKQWWQDFLKRLNVCSIQQATPWWLMGNVIIPEHKDLQSFGDNQENVCNSWSKRNMFQLGFQILITEWCMLEPNWQITQLCCISCKLHKNSHLNLEQRHFFFFWGFDIFVLLGSE